MTFKRASSDPSILTRINVTPAREALDDLGANVSNDISDDTPSPTNGVRQLSMSDASPTRIASQVITARCASILQVRRSLLVGPLDVYVISLRMHT